MTHFSNPLLDVIANISDEQRDELHRIRSGAASRESTQRAYEELTEPVASGPFCPKCGGPTWDNRTTKRSAKSPDYKCRARSCDGVIWPPREHPVPMGVDVAEVAAAQDTMRVLNLMESLQASLATAQQFPRADFTPDYLYVEMYCIQMKREMRAWVAARFDALAVWPANIRAGLSYIERCVVNATGRTPNDAERELIRRSVRDLMNEAEMKERRWKLLRSIL
jgi:hypothetical protein